MLNNLVYQILKLELSKLENGISIKDINFIKDSDKSLLTFYIDASGFDLELVEEQMVELENLNRSWRKSNEGVTLCGFITMSSIIVDEQKIAFRMLKTDFIDFVTQEKLRINTTY
ncbi:hypothetical protein [Formosa algae]|uniref:hypothetical protein n=1 Tax=Formosa algae TaxID=225843 RepID=UPI000CCE295C|nr:hypothetical protein [Formosa algae]PNW27817.1 hypothetical protein BKP44_11605 [Formosa algae]